MFTVTRNAHIIFSSLSRLSSAPRVLPRGRVLLDRLVDRLTVHHLLALRRPALLDLGTASVLQHLLQDTHVKTDTAATKRDQENR